MRQWPLTSLMFAAMSAACPAPNPDHCGNLDGHATCEARGGDTRFCSKCTADNNGCVATPVSPECDAGETSAAGTTAAPSTTAALATTAASTSGAPTSDPTTSSASSSSASSSTGSSSGSSSSDSSSAGESTGASTGEPPLPTCGNNIREPPEVCDGTDLNDLDCVAKDMDKYSGGTLQCAANCMAYDEQNCCLAPGQACRLDGHDCCTPGQCLLNCK